MDWYNEDHTSRVYLPTKGDHRVVICGWRVRKKEWYVMACLQFNSPDEAIRAFNTITCMKRVWD